MPRARIRAGNLQALTAEQLSPASEATTKSAPPPPRTASAPGVTKGPAEAFNAWTSGEEGVAGSA